MPLHRRLLVIAVLIALVAAVLTDFVVTRVRAADRVATLERIADSFLTDSMQEICAEDPRWFLAGPRGGRPSAAERQMVDADVYLPRPKTDPLPFEFFPFDNDFIGSSTASPRFPDAFKRAMRQTPPAQIMSGSFDSDAGSGWQVARLTGWTPGPCAVLLFRSRPEPGAWRTRALVFGLSFALSLAVAWLAFGPTAGRIRRLAASAKQSARAEYTEKVSISGTDEIASLGAVFNEASADLRRKMVEAADREEALQRHVTMTTEDVAVPLAEVSAELAALDREGGLSSPTRETVRHSIRAAHQLAARLDNLGAVARLRTGIDRMVRERVDVGAIVRDVLERRAALAGASGVTFAPSLPASPVFFDADPKLLALAIGNVVDNAVFYNRPGGRVEIELKSYDRDGLFALRIADNGPGVSDDEYEGLTANRRFRGDESRSRRPGGRGLGLAVSREVADRFGLFMDIRRPSTGGLEVEFGVRKDR
jgi:signal transduction histidine kinase